MDTVLGSEKDDNARDEGVLLFLFFFNKGPAVVLMKRLRAPALGIGLLSSNLDLVTWYLRDFSESLNFPESHFLNL